MCSELADQQDGKAVPDGMGGTIVAWTDYRSGLQNSDVYAQRINSSGEALWAAGGIKVCGAPDVQKEPAISFSRAEVLASESENGAIIVWTDKGGGGYDIYGQRINLAGKTLWKEDGIPICEIEGTQKDPKIVENGAGGAIVVFEDYRFGNWDIYCQKINKKGDLLWPAPGIPITKAPGTQYSPDIAPSNSGGAIITWEDYRSSLGYMIYAQKIEGDGKISWQQNGISICNLPGGQRNPKIIGNGGGGAVISWEDYRSGGYGIYAQRIRVIKLQ
ncbi:MAG: hypothetical protein NT030_01985 [Candidatus Saganbacteria bacterium]|nr:hypothetical protein [Candidatus Saganbacteria bacterium]